MQCPNCQDNVCTMIFESLPDSWIILNKQNEVFCWLLGDLIKLQFLFCIRDLVHVYIFSCSETLSVKCTNTKFRFEKAC